MRVPTLLLSLFLSAVCLAAVPAYVNYQGYLTRANGTALETTVAITFTLYDAPAAAPRSGARRRTRAASGPDCSVSVSVLSALCPRVSFPAMRSTWALPWAVITR
jgi:hypothetical protein